MDRQTAAEFATAARYQAASAAGWEAKAFQDRYTRENADYHYTKFIWTVTQLADAGHDVPRPYTTGYSHEAAVAAVEALSLSLDAANLMAAE